MMQGICGASLNISKQTMVQGNPELKISIRLSTIPLACHISSYHILSNMHLFCPHLTPSGPKGSDIKRV